MFFQCVENVSRANCPVCLEDIHTSRIPCHIPMCGHLLHRTCFEQLLQAGHYACPICQTSLMDMTQLWKYLDQQVANTPMPPEYKDYIVYILCKDCHKVSKWNLSWCWIAVLNCSRSALYLSMWWDLNVVIVGLIILAGLKVLWILEVSNFNVYLLENLIKI